MSPSRSCTPNFTRLQGFQDVRTAAQGRQSHPPGANTYDYDHRQSLHRDIKPANIVIEPEHFDSQLNRDLCQDSFIFSLNSLLLLFYILFHK